MKANMLHQKQGVHFSFVCYVLGDTGEQGDYDDAPHIGGPPPTGVLVVPSPPASLRYKKTTLVGDKVQSLGLEERIALNKDIKHDVVTAQDWAVNGETYIKLTRKGVTLNIIPK